MEVVEVKLDLNNQNEIRETKTCEDCVHKDVCGKRVDLEALVYDIKKIISYSRYNEFKVFVDCKYGSPDVRNDE